MNQRKPNRIVWYSLALVLLLCAAFLVTSTGTAFARYRTERSAKVTFEVREPEQICLGTLALDGTFRTSPPAWTTGDDTPRLNLAVANGTSADDCSQRDQTVSLRLIGSLGIDTAPMYLTLPGEETQVTATITPITEGTALYHTHGAGWIYTFLDEEGEELTWTLPGGELSYVSLTVTMDALPETLSLIQPMVTGKTIGG